MTQPPSGVARSSTWMQCPSGKTCSCAPVPSCCCARRSAIHCWRSASLPTGRWWATDCSNTWRKGMPDAMAPRIQGNSSTKRRFQCATRCCASSSTKPLTMDSSAWSSKALASAMSLRAWAMRSNTTTTTAAASRTMAQNTSAAAATMLRSYSQRSSAWSSGRLTDSRRLGYTSCREATSAGTPLMRAGVFQARSGKGASLCGARSGPASGKSGRASMRRPSFCSNTISRPETSCPCVSTLASLASGTSATTASRCPSRPFKGLAK